MNLSLRMLTICSFAALALNFSNYMFVKYYYNLDGQRVAKFYYPRTVSGVAVERSFITVKQTTTTDVRTPTKMESPATLTPETTVYLSSASSPTERSMSSVTQGKDDTTIAEEREETDSLCADVPPGLGPISDFDYQMSIQEFESKYGDLKNGGIYQPITCQARQSVAVLIAYRGCRRYLAMFLFVLHPLLIKQQLDYQVFVIEQSNNSQTFNRGKLLNVGFMEAQKLRQPGWTCLVMHEAHLLPTDTRNMYRCSWYPRQLATKVERPDKFPYVPMFGGAIAMTSEQFLKVNGFSNNYWGNDADIEDLYNRITVGNYFVQNSIPAISKYKTLPKYSAAERLKSEYMETIAPLYLLDGLTSLSYTVESFELRRMYTYIKVNIDDQNNKETSEQLIDKLLEPSPSPNTSTTDLLQVKPT